jgi:hypothetical protein
MILLMAYGIVQILRTTRYRNKWLSKLNNTYLVTYFNMNSKYALITYPLIFVLSH